jgi:preprotein translocase subunit SecF
MQEVPSSTCLLCQTSFTKDDIIPLNPPENEQKILKQKLEERLASNSKEKRKEKKHKQEKTSISQSNNNNNNNNNNNKEREESSGSEKQERKRKHSKISENESKKPCVQSLAAVKVCLCSLSVTHHYKLQRHVFFPFKTLHFSHFFEERHIFVIRIVGKPTQKQQIE